MNEHGENPDEHDETAPVGKTTVRPLAELREADATVAVREVETPKGTRLELESVDRGERIRLDAVALESLTWQDRETYERFLDPDAGGDSGERDAESDAEAGDDRYPNLVATDRIDDASTTRLVDITNEFAHVVVREVATPDRTLVELTAPKMDFTVYLNALALDGVVRQSTATFTELLRRRVE